MKNLTAFIILIATINVTLGSNSIPDKVCSGTSGRLSLPGNYENHYRQLRARYTNCTYVNGNLEITWLQSPDLDLSFLNNIREVSGYVLISHVDVPKVILPRLQIVRGERPFKLDIIDNKFALFVTISKMYNLEMPALKEIINGSVGFYNNYNLCHIKTINWDKIMSGKGSFYSYVYNFTIPERICPECDQSCEQGCWGVGPKNCQRFPKSQCALQCWPNRCFGPNPLECCHSNCAGGCTGQTARDCITCKHIENDGECVSVCPPNMYIYAGNCVNYQTSISSICVTNNTHPCTKICKIEAESTFLDSSTIDNFKGCTIIEGSLAITDLTFRNYQKIYQNFTVGPQVEPMHPDKLEVLSTVKEITGYLYVSGVHQDFKNLSCLRNLQVIGGSSLADESSSLYIKASSLTSLGLRSLNKITTGSVFIAENKNLCYASSLDWKKIKNSEHHEITYLENKDETDCINDGMICDEECSMQGCWGPGPSQCISCKNVILDDACAASCNKTRVYQVGYHTCKTCPEDHYFELNNRHCSPCDPECQGCLGLGSNKCYQCKNFKLYENSNDIHNQSAAFTCVNKCPTEHHLMKLCFNNSMPATVDGLSKSSIADDFIIVNTNAVDNFKPNHRESNGVCKGSDPHSCTACKYVRESLVDFLKPFPQYRKISSE